MYIDYISFSPDGIILASLEGNVPEGDNCIRLWDTKTGNIIKMLEGHTQSVTCVQFSHDSKMLATGSRDYSVKVWDISNLDNIKLIWTTNPQLFCKGMNIKDVKGLSNLNRKFLHQRGAIEE